MLDWCVRIQQVDAMFDFARFWCCWLFEHICIARAQLLPSCINCLGAACCMGTLHLHLALACCIAWHRCIICCCALHCCIVGALRCIGALPVASPCIVGHCTLHGHCALATCTGMLLCIASMHRLLHCTASLHCLVHCIALRLRLQVRCYFWCSRLQLLHGERWPGTTPYYTHAQASDSTRTANIAHRCFLCFMHC